jgi:hypothetical protein
MGRQPWRKWFNGALFLVLLLQISGAVDLEYRSADGYLGRTMPRFQVETINGTRPVPYVYRQGVPRIRQLLMRVLPPGHAAMAVDLGFAAIALLAGFALGRYAFGADRDFLGAITVALAVMGVFPNLNPEAVAMVASVLVAFTCLIYERYLAAAVVVSLSAGFRTELPVLFGMAALVAVYATGGDAQRRRVRLGIFCLPVIVGIAYLALCRLVLWPQAHYGEPAFQLPYNLTIPARYPWVALNLLLIAVGLYWAWSAWNVARTASGEDLGEARQAEIRAKLGIGLYIFFYVTAATILGRPDEIRLVMPILPVIFMFAGSRWPVCRWGPKPNAQP